MGARVKTGILGLDTAIDGLRIGDNVVWQVDTFSSYQCVVKALWIKPLRTSVGLFMFVLVRTLH